jgi:hypothetical protein
MTEQFRTCKYEESGGKSVSTRADTNGWDTVYVVRGDVVNQGMREHFAPLVGTDAFRMQQKLASKFFKLNIDAAFGPWQVCGGGAGNKVHLSLPIISGKATIQMLESSEVDLSGSVAIIEVSLGYHAPPDFQPGQSLAAQLKIVNDMAAPAIASAGDLKAAAAAPAGANDEIRVVRIKGGPGFDPDIEGNVSAGIKEWLVSHKALFDYVFLSVDVAEEAATGDFAWIKPTTVGYAVADVGSDDGKEGNDVKDAKDAKEKEVKDTDILFAVLAMTQNRKPGRVAAMVPVNAIPANEGANSAFLIGPHLIIEKFIRPKLHTLFEGAKPEHFKIAPGDGLVIQNVEDVKLKLKLEPEWYSGADSETIATVSKYNFSVKVDGRTLTTAFHNVRFPYGGSDEIDIQLAYECSCYMGLDENDRFAFTPVEPPVSTLSVAQNQEKGAIEVLKTIGWTFVAQLATAAVFHGLGKLAGKAASTLKGGTVARLAGEEAGVIEQNVKNAINIEMESAAKAGKNATLALTSAERSIWSTIGGALRKGSVGVLEFIQSGLTNSLVIMMAGQLAGSVYGERSQLDLISALHEDPKKMNAMTDFAGHCVSPITWPHTPHSTLVCAGLNQAFTLALHTGS